MAMHLPDGKRCQKLEPCSLSLKAVAAACKAASAASRGAAAAARAVGRTEATAILVAAGNAIDAAVALLEQPDPGAESEVHARLEAIEPVIAEKVQAGREQRTAALSGGQRARRNLAEHEGFGCGPGVVAGSDAVVKARQRRGRKHSKSNGAVSVCCAGSGTSSDCTLTPATSAAESACGSFDSADDSVHTKEPPVEDQMGGCPGDSPGLVAGSGSLRIEGPEAVPAAAIASGGGPTAPKVSGLPEQYLDEPVLYVVGDDHRDLLRAIAIARRQAT